MAGDWIKMRVNLVAHPKVMRLAELLLEDHGYLRWSGLSFGVGTYPAPSQQELRDERYAALRITRYVCVTGLLRFWGYANEHAKGESIASLGQNDVDEIVGIPNFGITLESVGWLVFKPDGGVILPGFSEHNTSAEARKSTAADRQKAYRERLKQKASLVTSRVTQRSDVTSHAREEKRRDITPIVPKGAKAFLDGAPPGFIEFWRLWPAGPRKEAGAKCLAEWREKKLEQDAPVILTHVATLKKSRQWRDGYDPAPLVYLRKGAWIGAEPEADSTQQRMVV